jgi:hypothetical protein
MATGLEKTTASRIRWLRRDSIDPDGESGGMTTHALDLPIGRVRRWRHPGARARAGRRRPGLPSRHGDLATLPICHDADVGEGGGDSDAAFDCGDANAGAAPASELLHRLLICAAHGSIPLPTG